MDVAASQEIKNYFSSLKKEVEHCYDIAAQIRYWLPFMNKNGKMCGHDLYLDNVDPKKLRKLISKGLKLRLPVSIAPTQNFRPFCQTFKFSFFS